MNSRISVIGTGYLGATHAASMAELGFEVIGVDTDPHKVRTLNEGLVPFSEPGLPELLRRHVASGRLRFSTDLAQAARFADVHFICVGTPQSKDGLAADLSAVEAAVHSLARSLRRDAAIIGKSTVPVGTADRLAARVATLIRPGLDVSVSWNPEFLREGHGVHDTLHPDRLVFGVTSERAEQTLRAVYARVIEQGTRVHVTSPATAELAKVAANAFLATKISFINELADLCEIVGADVKEVAAGMGYDARIGRHFLDAGLGWGGSCFPKDVQALAYMAKERGLTPRILNDVMDVNYDRRKAVSKQVEALLGGSVRGKTIGMLGLAFKENTDDMRDAPSVDISNALIASGARVRGYDPVARETAAPLMPAVEIYDDVYKMTEGCDALIVVTPWNEFKQLDLEKVKDLLKAPIIYDGRNIYDPQVMKEMGFTYHAIGRAAKTNGK